eukprot:361987-Chlamydomonas_euryale.AAC.4
MYCLGMQGALKSLLGRNADAAEVARPDTAEGRPGTWVSHAHRAERGSRRASMVQMIAAGDFKASRGAAPPARRNHAGPLALANTPCLPRPFTCRTACRAQACTLVALPPPISPAAPPARPVPVVTCRTTCQASPCCPLALEPPPPLICRIARQFWTCRPAPPCPPNAAPPPQR